MNKEKVEAIEMHLKVKESIPETLWATLASMLIAKATADFLREVEETLENDTKPPIHLLEALLKFLVAAEKGRGSFRKSNCLAHLTRKEIDHED